MKCPAGGCDYESNERGVKTHYGKTHDKPAPWKSHICDRCGEEFERSNSLVRNGGTFCSYECGNADRDRSKNLVAVNCDWCGEEVVRYPSHLSETNFCSTSCHGKWVETWPTEKFGGYKGGGLSRYYGGEWNEQRQKALDAENTCTFKGCEKAKCEDGKSLHVHHIKPARKFDSLDEAHQQTNLRVLCAEHHAKIEP